MLVAVVLSTGATAQTTTNPPTPASAEKPQAPPVPAQDDAWSFAASVYTYIVPDDDNYVQPTFTADRGWLHLEGRLNYEALNSGSAWFGYNFSGGDALAWEITPMFGAVFGDTSGVAPGYKGSLGWWKLEFYSEGEHVFDAGDSSESFFYNWSELTLAPVDWFWFGLVTQRTRAYEADREIQRGLLVGASYGNLEAGFYFFNPDDDEPTFVISAGLSF